MTEITLYNTRSRTRERLEPLDPTNVRMYVCGPTVYDRAHIGNARPALVFDALFRLLRFVYGEDHVTYVRNFTDVDDKINARAAETGRPIHEITTETIRWYVEDMAELGVLDPTEMPCATAYVPQMVAMIGKLLEKGHAYEAEGHVLFRVSSFPDYGSLSGRTVDDMIAGARVEIAPYKDSPMDFVLWKPSHEGVPGWESPWGRGRPGWHIECSAMALELLGATFDIHGGGNDLTFPHHENEIAQSMCAHPQGEFARVWMHNEMLQVEGRKMAKSAGNFHTVRELLDEGIPGEVIRLVFLSTHYRKPMDWSGQKRHEAEATLRKWYGQAMHGEDGEEPPPAVVSALANDLNTAGAITELHRLSRANRPDELRAGLRLIGLMGKEVPAWVTRARISGDVLVLVERLLKERADARAAKDFVRADVLRDGFAAAGLIVRDTPDGAVWEASASFDPTKLEAFR